MSKWLIAMALAAVPGAFGAGTVLPGTVNYIQGQVTINGTPVRPVQNGSRTLMTGQTLSVGTGKAEILLTPGTFLRVGNGSDVRMVSADLANTEVEVLHGEAMIEVDYKPKMARLDVMEHGATTQLLKEGLYKFDANAGTVQVLDGKASVAENGHSKDIGKGKEVTLANASLKPVKFDTKDADNDSLYRWSSVRDSYLAQANEASAQTAYVDGNWGPGWGAGWGYGWDWNPYYGTYAWLPGDGYFWSPFGYPFFSPGYAIYAPGIRYGNRGFGHAGQGHGRAFAGVGRIGHVGAGRVGGMAAAPRMGGRSFAGGRMGGGAFGGGRMGGGGGHMGGGGGHMGGGGGHMGGGGGRR